MSRKLIGYVAVDSGQLMICDPCYILSEWTDDVDFDANEGSNDSLYPFDYNGASNASMSINLAGQLMFDMGHAGAGVSFSSGFGDGYYPVYAEYIEDGNFGLRIAKVEVVMIQEYEG